MAAKSRRKRTANLEQGARAAFYRAASGNALENALENASISVVIAARNEADHLPRLLRALAAMPEVGEIIVSDGQSRDETVQIARESGALVTQGPPSRGAQQNRGAALASGEILWFLHADALPKAKCGRQIGRAAGSGAPGGNFRMRFEARGVWPRVFEAIARFQRRRGAYYGDSGIWATRAAWNELGGFRAWPLFEDLDFARRLEGLARRRNQKTACCAGRLQVSARRFRKSPLRVLTWWLVLQIGFDLGVSPFRLALFYGRNSKNESRR